MLKNSFSRTIPRLALVTTAFALACVPAAGSNYASLITEVREIHTPTIHPELVTARDRGGHLFVSGQVGRDPGTPAATHGTVIVEVRSKDGGLVRETKGCFQPEFEPNFRHSTSPAKPPRFYVDLGEGYEEPMTLVVRLVAGECSR